MHWLAAVGGWLTVWDSFGTPGDTISTATVSRILKEHFRGLRINVITPNPDLLRLDPAIDLLNAPPTRLVLRFWYLDIIERKDGQTNLLAPSLAGVGISEYDYHARFYLSDEEKAAGKARVASLRRPIITVNAHSREKVKMWLNKRWREVTMDLSRDFDLVQLGTPEEPELPGVTRLAGQLSMRESAAVLATARLHLGGVSFLMHVANGLDVPSVIIYGGRETPLNSGYASNTNLYARVACSPCWLHDSRGDICPYEMQCMQSISAATVVGAVEQLLRRQACNVA
ncbi:MAG: hypothetical protein H7039_18745, partial [Bryobacteraceae bacterium]|nr:hypothetical protein [Bryobacteraceae bacterium]